MAKARLAQAEGPYPGNVQAAEIHLRQAVLVSISDSGHRSKPGVDPNVSRSPCCICCLCVCNNWHAILFHGLVMLVVAAEKENTVKPFLEYQSSMLRHT